MLNRKLSSQAVDALLKTQNLSLPALVRELTAQNLKLQKQIVKCQAQDISDKNRISALQAELKESQHGPSMVDQLKAARKRVLECKVVTGVSESKP